MVGGYFDSVSLGVYNATVVIASVISFLSVIPLVTTLFADTSFKSGTPAEASSGVTFAFYLVTLAFLPAKPFAAAVAL